MKMNSADRDVAFQLFSCGMVWDGNVASKAARDRLVSAGYAVRHGGMQALTGRGAFALLLSPMCWRAVLIRLRRYGRTGLIADAERIKKAMQ